MSSQVIAGSFEYASSCGSSTSCSSRVGPSSERRHANVDKLGVKVGTLEGGGLVAAECWPGEYSLTKRIVGRGSLRHIPPMMRDRCLAMEGVG